MSVNRPLPQPRSSTTGAVRPKIAGQSSGPASGSRLTAVLAHSDCGEDVPGYRDAMFVFDRAVGSSCSFPGCGSSRYSIVKATAGFQSWSGRSSRHGGIIDHDGPDGRDRRAEGQSAQRAFLRGRPHARRASPRSAPRSSRRPRRSSRRATSPATPAVRTWSRRSPTSCFTPPSCSDTVTSPGARSKPSWPGGSGSAGSPRKQSRTATS